jgi:hypothetical protein
MKTIWKYVLTPETTLHLPEGAEVLTVQTQNGAPVVWVLQDRTREARPRTLRAYATGETLPAATQGCDYIGTFQTDNLVFHVFDTTAIEPATWRKGVTHGAKNKYKLD